MEKTIPDSGEKIAEEARDSIGDFCRDECKGYCCRKGYLVLTKEQVPIVTQGRQRKMIKDELLMELDDGRFSMFMGKYDHPCPSLYVKNFRCTIYKDRPQTCKDFPLFLVGKSIRLSPRCLAVKENKFYPYVAQLLKLGYKMEKWHPYSDMELQNTVIIPD